MMVLIVTSVFPSSGLDAEGSFVRDQARALALLGREVDVAVLRAGPRIFPRSIHRNDPPLHQVLELEYVPYPLAFGVDARTRALGAQLAPLRRLIARGSYRAAIIHDELAAAAAGPLLDWAGVPWVVVVHGLNRSPRMLGPAGKRLKMEVYQRAARVIRVGPGVEVPPQVASEVVPNGANFLEAGGAPPPSPTAGVMALSVSGLRPGKGIEGNLRALAELHRRGIDVGYWVAGDGPMRTRLERLAAGLGVGHTVRFLGTVSRDRLGAYLAACDFFSLPSSPEAYGIAYLEAMLHGKPVIACREAGPASFVADRKSGLLVPPGDTQSLAAAWQALAADSVLRRRMGTAARQAASERSWEVNAARLGKILEEISSEAVSSRRRLLWLGVERTSYMDAAVHAGRARLDAEVTVAFLRGGGDLPWPRLLRSIGKRAGEVLLVEGWGGGWPFLAALALARLRGVPYVVGSDTHTARTGRLVGAKEILKRLILQPLLRHAAVLFPGGTPQARHVRSLADGTSPRVVIAHMTVDTDFFADRARSLAPAERSAIRSAWGCTDDDLALLFVGRLEPEKGLNTLLDAVASLAEEPVRLVLYGEGRLRTELERRRASGLPIHLAGRAAPSLLASAYAAADVFVLPSTFEPWGLVLNEAMAAGLPCLASDRVGAREDLIQDGVTGSVFPAGDAHALAERLRPLLRDADLRARFGAAGHDRVMSSWSLDVYADSLARALEMAGWSEPR